MSSVKRVYVEKKPDFAVQAKELKHVRESMYMRILRAAGRRAV